MAGERPRAPARRARPVAEVAFDPLLERIRELARRWAVALVGGVPYDSLGAIPLEELAREAPELLGAVLGALRSDGELEQLLEEGRSGGSPAGRVPALTGAAGSESVVGALESMRGILWEALLDEFGPSSPDALQGRSLTDLADRLAQVCALMVPAALAGVTEAGGAAAVSVAPEPAGPPAGRVAPTRTFRRSRAVIVDDHAPDDQAAAPETQVIAAPGRGLAEPALVEEIQIRDERGDEGPAAWIRSIGRRLERFEHDGVPFGVLLVELRPEGGGPGEGSWSLVEELLAQELRTGGEATMTRERAGRYWLLAPGADRLSASGLASRITRALEALVVSRGLGLSVAIGTAVCPEDGRRAASLAAHADVGLYAARAERNLAAPAEGRRRL